MYGAVQPRNAHRGGAVGDAVAVDGVAERAVVEEEADVRPVLAAATASVTLWPGPTVAAAPKAG